MKKVSIGTSKGGTGTTFLVVNLGVSLAHEGKRVLLVDLEMDHADVATALNVTPRMDFGLYFMALQKGDTTDLTNFITPVEAVENLYLLSPDMLPQRTPVVITPDMIMSLFTDLASAEEPFDYVFFDGLDVLTPGAVQTLDSSDDVFFVFTPEISSLNALQAKLSVLKHMYFAPQKVRLILNNTHPDSMIPAEEVIKAVDPFIVLLEVPYGGDRVRESLEFGEPLVLMEKDNPAIKAVRDLADFLMEKINEDELLRRHKKKKGFSLFGRKKETPRRSPQKTALSSQSSMDDSEDLDALLSEAIQMAQMEESGVEGATSLEEGLAQEVPTQPLKSKKTSGDSGREIYRVSQERDEAWLRWKEQIHKLLLTRINWKEFGQVQRDSEAGAELRRKVESIVLELMDMVGVTITDKDERRDFVQEILDEALGYGPLEVLLRDDSVTEIMVNGPFDIFIERGGKIYKTDVRFLNEEQLRVIIDRILAPLGKRVDDSMPYADARLPDGSRVNVIIPPLALNGSTVTIRKFSKKKLTEDDLIRFGSIIPQMVQFLKACVYVRKNILVSGGTGTGKTTFLNMLSRFIPEGERIVTIEDTAELQLQQEHVVRLESRPPNVEGTGEVTIRDLVKNALRMRPDRIVVGECRGGEALDMLQAMNTGHDGSMTTLHANSPRDALSRLETMVLMAGTELPSKAIRQQIASAVHLIVQLGRLRDGSRKVVAISEITGMEGDIITMQDIFVFRQTGVDPETGKVLGKHTATGVRPTFYEELGTSGITLPPDLFHPDPEFQQSQFQFS